MKTIRLHCCLVIMALGACAKRDGPQPKQEAENGIMKFHDAYHARIDRHRYDRTSRDTWEKDIELIHEIKDFAQLKSTLEGWVIPKTQMAKYEAGLQSAAFCGFYRTDGDGRMVIFYDQKQRSFDTWGSWYQYNEFNELAE